MMMLFDQHDHEVLVRVATKIANLQTSCNSGGLSSLAMIKFCTMETAKQRTWPSEVSRAVKRSSVRPVGNHEEKEEQNEIPASQQHTAPHVGGTVK